MFGAQITWYSLHNIVVYSILKLHLLQATCFHVVGPCDGHGMHDKYAITYQRNISIPSLLSLVLQLHCETSGKEALKWVAEGKVLPDLILLDCMMPGMSGMQSQSQKQWQALCGSRHVLTAGTLQPS